MVQAKPGRTAKEEEFLKEFWQTTNRNYGDDCFRRNKMTQAVELYDEAMRYNPKIGQGSGKHAPRQQEKHFIEVTLDDTYRHNPKQQHPIYPTTSNTIGYKKPNPKIDGPGRIYPHSNSFTKTFPPGVRRDTGLNTSVTKNRYM